MQKEFTQIGGVSLVYTDTKEQLIECEAVLPDYYPEIGKVLKCSVCVGIEDITQSGDKVSVAGKAEIKLLYTDSENRINVYSVLSKYTKVFGGCGEQADTACFVSQTVGSVQHRAIAPRRCEIRASAAIKLMCVGKTEKKVLSRLDSPDTEVRYGELELFNISAVKQLELNFSDTVELPPCDEKITGVLYSSQSICFSEERVIKNKVMLKGSCEINARFLTEGGGLTPEASFSLPFTEIVPLSGAEDDDLCRLSAEGVCLRAVPDEQGKTAQLFISASVKCACGGQKAYSLPDDVYSVREDTLLTQEELCVISAPVPVEKQFSVTSDAECYDGAAQAVTGFFTDTPVCNLMLYEGQARLTGSVGVNFLVRDASGGVSLISRSCPFDEPTEITEGTTGFCSSEAKITAASLRNGRIDYTLKIEAEAWWIKSRKMKFLADAEFEKSSDKNRACEKIVLYYARKGESIWSIAKENGCSAGKIKELNGITEDKTEESRMLVLVK